MMKHWLKELNFTLSNDSNVAKQTFESYLEELFAKNIEIKNPVMNLDLDDSITDVPK